MSLRGAVIGMGSMGRNHLRLNAEIQGGSLVAAADPFPQSHSALKSFPGVNAYTDYREMIEKENLDYVAIAAPTKFHCEMSCFAMEAGAHVLVEKPIASSLEEADQMIAVAQKTGRTLMVGHLERFNPAVVEAKRRIESGEIGHIFQLAARRHSPFPARITDVGVVLDIAVHDIDVMHFLTGQPAVRCYAELQQRAHGTQEDMLTGLLRFKSSDELQGVVGLLDVHWMSPQKVRQLTVTGMGGTYTVDYINQDLYFHTNGTTETTWHEIALFRGTSEGDMIRPHIVRREPLRVEYEAFIDAITHGTKSPVSGEEGKAALKVALDLVRSGELNEVLTS